MGLLDRVRTLNISPADGQIEDLSEIVGSLISTIRKGSKHIDYPGEVFRAFKRILGFSKGAFLFPDESKGVFYPWITEGLDRTTIRRLRIAVDFPPLAGAGSQLVKIDSKDLAPMVSNRELGLLEDPCFILLGDAVSPTALILAANRPDGGELSPDLLQHLQRMNDALGKGIPESRSIMGKADEDADILWNESDGVVVILDASKAVDAVMEAVPGLELYRAGKDVAGLVRHVTGRMGRVFHLKDGRIIVFFSRKRMPDRDLYLRQLSQAFGDAYENLANQPEFSAVFLDWPAERDSLNRLSVVE